MRAPESGAETEGDHLGLPAGDGAVATQACKQAAPLVEGATLGPQGRSSRLQQVLKIIILAPPGM